MIALTINGTAQSVDADADTPLLWVLRDHLALTGTKFGCGRALCGACTVHVDGAPVRSCLLPLSAVGGKSVTTIEGLSKDRSHRQTRQNPRHHRNECVVRPRLPAQIVWSIKIVEKEFRGVVEAPALQQVLMRAREPGRLPAAQQRPPPAEARVLDEAAHAAPPRGRVRPAAGRERFPSPSWGFLYRNGRRFIRLNASEQLFARAGTRYGGKNPGE